MKRLIVFTVIIFLCLILPSCNSGKGQLDSANFDVVLGCQSNVSAIAQTYLEKQLLEDKGFTVDVKIMPNEDLWTGIVSNDIHAIGCNWFYDVHYNNYKKVSADVMDLGANCEDLKKGIVVPNYANIADIDELRLHKKSFGGTIYVNSEFIYLGELIDKANESYSLDYEIKKLSKEEMIKTIESAIDKKEWIAFGGYVPHWLFKKYSLRVLEDTKKVFGKTQELHTVVNKNLETNNKEIYNILDKFYIYNWELNDLLLNINIHKDNKDIEQITEEWLKDNPMIKDRIS